MHDLSAFGSTAPERWWIGFTDNHNYGPPWSWFTRHRRRHCFMFTDLNDEVTVILEPLSWRQQITVTGTPVRKVVDQCRAKGFDLLLVERGAFDYDPSRFSVWHRSPFLTCASTIAYTLGLKGWIYTPQKLWQAVLDAGGLVVIDVGLGDRSRSERAFRRCNGALVKAAEHFRTLRRQRRSRATRARPRGRVENAT